MASLSGGHRDVDVDDVRMRDPADRDADLLRALVGQLIDDHRAASLAACADQAAHVRLARAAPPHLSYHGTRQDYLDRAVQRLIEDAEHERHPPVPRDERACAEDEPSHAACPALPA